MKVGAIVVVLGAALLCVGSASAQTPFCGSDGVEWALDFGPFGNPAITGIIAVSGSSDLGQFCVPPDPIMVGGVLAVSLLGRGTLFSLTSLVGPSNLCSASHFRLFAPFGSTSWSGNFTNSAGSSPCTLTAGACSP